MPTSKLIFIDETGFIVGMNRLYGWSRRGEQAIISRKTRGKRLSVVGAMSLDGSRGMMTLEGTLNTEKMLTFVEEHLGPNIQEGDIVVMDGCSVHKSTKVREAIEKHGGKVLILPPYSPDYNPIEHLWSTMKARVRAVGCESWGALKELVDTTWSGIEAEFFGNWIKNCGYSEGCSH